MGVAHYMLVARSLDMNTDWAADSVVAVYYSDMVDKGWEDWLPENSVDMRDRDWPDSTPDSLLPLGEQHTDRRGLLQASQVEVYRRDYWDNSYWVEERHKGCWDNYWDLSLAGSRPGCSDWDQVLVLRQAANHH